MIKDLVISISGLTRYYGANPGLLELDLDIERGEVFGYLGPNGAGKTTTIRMLLGLLAPTRGEGTVLGQPLGDVEVRARIGYLPGELTLDERMTGTQLLDFMSALSPPTVGLGGGWFAARRTV